MELENIDFMYLRHNMSIELYLYRYTLNANICTILGMCEELLITMQQSYPTQMQGSFKSSFPFTGLNIKILFAHMYNLKFTTSPTVYSSQN